MIASMKASAVNPHMPLWKLEIVDTTMTELVKLSRLHCKLALEHSRSLTSPERGRDIKAEITTIRARRDCLLLACRNG